MDSSSGSVTWGQIMAQRKPIRETDERIDKLEQDMAFRQGVAWCVGILASSAVAIITLASGIVQLVRWLLGLDNGP